MKKGWKEALVRLKAVEDDASCSGGDAQRERLGKEGRLTARERISYILDPGSFVELNMLAEHQCHDFGMEEKKFPGDGVVTGYGTVDGRRVFIYADDETVLGGSCGRTHGSKIHHVLRLARHTLVPVICLNSSAGARIQEGMDNVYGITGMFYENALNSGVVPQIAAIMGTSSGGSAYSSALCDFVLQVKKTSHLFLAGPTVIRESTGEEVSFEDLGSAEVHSTVSGVVHLVAEDERECLDKIKLLLDYLPQNNREKPQKKNTGDPDGREVPELLDIVPTDMSEEYNMKDVIRTIADGGEFLEIHEAFAGNLIVGYARMGGRVVGIVANNPPVNDGALDIDSTVKAARFIRTCDAFNTPLVTLVDSPGFRPGLDQERGGIIRHGAKMLYAWTEATVPKISVILRKMYQGAIPAMGVHEIGFDQVFAWPLAEMQILPAETAVRILYRRQLEAAEDSDAFFAEKLSQYRDTYLTPYHASSRSVVDAVIQPKDTRKTIISALRMLDTKDAPERARRKHGNMPL